MSDPIDPRSGLPHGSNVAVSMRGQHGQRGPHGDTFEAADTDEDTRSALSTEPARPPSYSSYLSTLPPLLAPRQTLAAVSPLPPSLPREALFSPLVPHLPTGETTNRRRTAEEEAVDSDRQQVLDLSNYPIPLQELLPQPPSTGDEDTSALEELDAMIADLERLQTDFPDTYRSPSRQVNSNNNNRRSIDNEPIDRRYVFAPEVGRHVPLIVAPRRQQRAAVPSAPVRHVFDAEARRHIPTEQPPPVVPRQQRLVADFGAPTAAPTRPVLIRHLPEPEALLRMATAAAAAEAAALNAAAAAAARPVARPAPLTERQRLMEVLKKENEEGPAPAMSRSCQVCFTEAPRRRAVFIACGHVLCRYCAEKMAEEAETERKRLICPFCRADSTFVPLFEDPASAEQ